MELTLELPDDAVSGLALLPEEAPLRLRLDLACAVYHQQLLSFGQSAAMAGLHPFLFGHELTRRGIPRNIGPQEIQQDADYVASLEHGGQ